MHLRDRAQSIWTLFFHDGTRRAFDRCGNAFWKGYSKLFTAGFQPAHELVPSKDRCRRNSEIGFGLGPLIDLNPPAVFKQGSLNHSLIGKFVGKRSVTVRPVAQQVLNYTRVSPSQQVIEIGKLLVEQIV